MSPRSLELIEAMRRICEQVQPITCRGVFYKLFVAKLIPSMAPEDIAPVYRLLKIARERKLIPWKWIVDDTRVLDRVSTWADPAAYAHTVSRSYRRDFWNQQPL